MRTCYNCKQRMICKYFQAYERVNTEALRSHHLSVSNNPDTKLSSWMNIFTSVAKACTKFEYDKWDVAVRIPEIEVYIDSLILELKNSQDDYLMELSDITIKKTKKMEILEYFLEGKNEEILDIINKNFDKIKIDDLEPGDFLEAFDNCFFEKMGM